VHDIQSLPDDRNIALEQVGVTDLSYPISVYDRARKRQQTIARFTMSVSLPHHFKGTHMSRFIEVLEGHKGLVTMRTVPGILRTLKRKLAAERARVEVRFPYFMERAAPATGAKGLMDYECSFVGEVNGRDDDFVLGVRIPVTSLCPCSKAISDYGAHNQRGVISIAVRSARGRRGERRIIWIEELVEVAERSASAPVYPLLKRADERHVTMQAYDNPVFVEDIVRNVAVRLQKDRRVSWFSVEAVNMESIHNHSAFARTSWQRPAAGRPSTGSG
jgi:GTP cyclohydrolase I